MSPPARPCHGRSCSSRATFLSFATSGASVVARRRRRRSRDADRRHLGIGGDVQGAHGVVLRLPVCGHRRRRRARQRLVHVDADGSRQRGVPRPAQGAAQCARSRSPAHRSRGDADRQRRQAAVEHRRRRRRRPAEGRRVFGQPVGDHRGEQRRQEPSNPALIDFWLEGRMQNYESTALDTGTRDGNLGVVYLGTRSMIGPDIMVGALAQFDRGVEIDQVRRAGDGGQGLDGGPVRQHEARFRRRLRRARRLGRDGECRRQPRHRRQPDGAPPRARQAHRHARGAAAGTWRRASGSSTSRTPCAMRHPARRAPPAPARSRCCPRFPSASRVDDVTFIEPRAAVGAFVGFDDLQAHQSGGAVGASDRYAVESGGRRRLRREGRLEPVRRRAASRAARHRDAAELDGAVAAQRSARQMTRFAAQQHPILSTSVLPFMQWKVISRVTHVTYSACCR